MERSFDISPCSAELDILMQNLVAIQSIFTVSSRKDFDSMGTIVQCIQESWPNYNLLIWTKNSNAVLDCCRNTFGNIASSLPMLMQVEEVGDSYNMILTDKISRKDWEFATEKMFEHWNTSKKVKEENEFLMEALGS
jgi:hypothetical protein